MCPSMESQWSVLTGELGKLEAEVAACLLSQTVPGEFSVQPVPGMCGGIQGVRASLLEVRVPFCAAASWLCDLGRLLNLSGSQQEGHGYRCC